MSGNEIPIRTLRNDVSAIIRRVEAGESFDVTRHGRHVARLLPAAAGVGPSTLGDLRRTIAVSPSDQTYLAEIRAMRDADLVRDPYER